jgi:hypothetical protein
LNVILGWSRVARFAEGHHFGVAALHLLHEEEDEHGQDDERGH